MAPPAQSSREVMMMGSASTLGVLRCHVQDAEETGARISIVSACDECGPERREASGEQNFGALIDQKAEHARFDRGADADLLLINATLHVGRGTEETGEMHDAFKHEAMVCATEIFFLLDASEAASEWRPDFEAEMCLADRIVLSGCGSLESSDLLEVMSQIRTINSEAPVVHAESGFAAVDVLPVGQDDCSADPFNALLGNVLLLTSGPQASHVGETIQCKSHSECAAVW